MQNWKNFLNNFKMKYSRGLCLGIHGVYFNNNEDNNVKENVKVC